MDSHTNETLARGSEPDSAPDRAHAIAEEALQALDSGGQIAPFSERLENFSLDEAYRVAAAVRRMREARGERVVGRKIGFTNRTIWAEYGVDAPIWGYIYDRTAHDLAEVGDGFALGSLPEPRIEPEIVFGLARAPEPGMDEMSLLSCLEWVAHGFEIVQSIFPAWRFAAADTVAAFGLHGALLIGPRAAVAPRAADWAEELASFAIALRRDGEAVDHARAVNVLGGPLLALAHFVEVLARDPVDPPLAPGEIVTTGTLTRALPVRAGETWSTELQGIALDGASVRLT